jgi:hypothetical protein
MMAIAARTHRPYPWRTARFVPETQPMRFAHAALALLTALPLPAAAQSMVRLKHLAPDGTLAGFLLTDGTLLFQGNQYTDWYRFTPDITGSYQNGTWTKAASFPAGYAPLYFASAVLPDGRVMVSGGEYNQGQFAFSNQCEIYDPVADTWTKFAPPAGWDYIGDSPSVVLPNGQFLIGSKFDKRLALLDAKTLTWTALSSAGKKDINAEEGWTLLPNGTFLTWDVTKAPNSEFYSPQSMHWKTAGQTATLLKGPPYVKTVHYGNGLIYRPPGEVGPGILRPDGTVFATGDTPAGASAGNTAIYTPGAHGAGTWTAGPSFPNNVSAGDGEAALLPTGNVLVQGSDTVLYEFNGAKLTPSQFTGLTYGSLFILPTGEAVVSGEALYRAAGSVNPAWAPAITGAPSSVTRGGTYSISGTQFNGLSQAAGFGDEVETATNYPLVRITNTATGHVFYARTHDHSTMAVATGTATVSTNFDVSKSTETGPATLAIIANGISSPVLKITVQ